MKELSRIFLTVAMFGCILAPIWAGATLCGTVLAALSIAGCGGPTPSGGNIGTGGSSGTGGGAGGPITADTLFVGPETSAGACNSLSLTGNEISEVWAPASARPTSHGGKIFEGTYVLTAATYYNALNGGLGTPTGPTGKTMRSTFQITVTRPFDGHFEGGLRAVVATDSRTPSAVYNFTDSFEVASAGLGFFTPMFGNANTSCPADSTYKDGGALYTATPTGLVLFYPTPNGNNATEVLTFVKQ